MDLSVRNLHGVDGPEDESQGSKRAKELGDLLASSLNNTRSGNSNVPNDKEVGNASNSIPSPLLSSVLAAKGSKQSSQNHDDVSSNRHQSVSTVNTRKQAEIEQQQRCSNGPVNISRPVHLAADLVVGVGDMLVVLRLAMAAEAGGIARRHGKVRERRRDGDERGDDVVQASRDGDLPRQAGEDGRRNGHDHEDDP